MTPIYWVYEMKYLKVVFISSAILLILVLGVVGISKLKKHGKTTGSGSDAEGTTTQEETTATDPFLLSDSITVDYLTVNPNSRPGTALEQVNAIVIHYVGNPGTTAAQNRSYFENLKDTQETSASSHYIVGLEGEIIQCVPLEEISYASNNRNSDTIAIECCHPDETGEFNSATYNSLVKLTAALCRTYGLDPDTDVIRHYDVTGKECPKYFVTNESAWYQFKLDLMNELNY